MDRRYHLTKEIVFLVWRVPRENAGYIQQILESHDNLCVCSTRAPLPDHPGTRDMEFYSPIEWEQELRRVLGSLAEKIPVSVLEDRILIDD